MIFVSTKLHLDGKNIISAPPTRDLAEKFEFIDETHF